MSRDEFFDPPDFRAEERIGGRTFPAFQRGGDSLLTGCHDRASAVSRFLPPGGGEKTGSGLLSAKPDRRFFLLVVLILGLSGGPVLAGTAVWYWANTVHRTAMDGLLSSGASCVFVKAGYWERTGNGLVFRRTGTAGYRAPSGAGPSVHLVFPFTPVLKDDLRRLDRELPRAVERALDDFRSAGFAVSGVQFDIEGDVSPDEYLGLVRTVKPLFPGMQVSACIDPVRLKNLGSPSLLKELDFLCVMFYDLSYSSRNYRLTDADWINRIANGPDMPSKPFFAGLPVYGCVTVFDAAGRLVHPRIDLPDFSVFHSDNVRLLGPAEAGLKKFRVEKAFSYKSLRFRPGMLLYLYDPGPAEIRALTERIAIGAAGFRGFAYFSCPVKKKFSFTFDDLLGFLGNGTRRD